VRTLVGVVDPDDGWPTPTRTTRSFPQEDAELVLGRPLRVFRQWQVSGTSLNSLNGEPWHAATAVAQCRRRSIGSRPDTPLHVVPDPRCSCGFYAFYRPDLIPTSVQGRVFGAAEVSGILICAELGVRAERMRILALTASADQTLGKDTAPLVPAALRRVDVYECPAALLADYPPDPAWTKLLGREPAGRRRRNR
jgi:hypothetical protein